MKKRVVINLKVILLIYDMSENSLKRIVFEKCDKYKSYSVVYNSQRYYCKEGNSYYTGKDYCFILDESKEQEAFLEMLRKRKRVLELSIESYKEYIEKSKAWIADIEEKLKLDSKLL